MPINVEWGSPDNVRGSGRTRRQLESAKRGAIFIWCNDHIGYPKQLALDIGRGDILIHGRTDLDDGAYRFRGRMYPEVVTDHACHFSDVDLEVLRELRSMART